MMKRAIAFMLTLPVLFSFAGCAEELQISSSSAAVSSSSAVSVPASVVVSSAPEEQVRLASLPLLESAGEEQVYILEGDRKDNIWSSRYYWVNEDRLLLFRKEDEQGEYRPLQFDFNINTVHPCDTDAEFLYSDDYYADETGIRFAKDGGISHYDHDLNVIKETAFRKNTDEIPHAVDLQNETLYYLEDQCLYREQDGRAELLKELPNLTGQGFYFGLQLSKDRRFLMFQQSVYEGQNLKSFWTLDLETGAMSELTDLFDPQIGWMDGQPLVFTYDEDEKQFLFSFRYGFDQTTVIEYAAMKDAAFAENVTMAAQNGICLLYSRRYTGEPERYRIACIREDETYFVYSGEHGENDILCFPALSPDQSYLSFVIAEEEYFTLHLIPTEDLWQPLDWKALERELLMKN